MSEDLVPVIHAAFPDGDEAAASGAIDGDQAAGFQSASEQFGAMASQTNVSDDTENMIGQLQTSTKDLPEAAKGMKQLNAGFKDKTSNIDQQIDDEIDEI